MDLSYVGTLFFRRAGATGVRISSAAVAEELGLVFAGLTNGTIVAWDLRYDAAPLARVVVYNAHRGDVSALCWHPYYRLLYSGGVDHEVKAWDPILSDRVDVCPDSVDMAEAGRALGEVLRDFRGSAVVQRYRGTVHPFLTSDQVIGGAGGSVRLCRLVQTLADHSRAVVQLAYASTHLLTIGADGNVLIYGPESGRSLVLLRYPLFRLLARVFLGYAPYSESENHKTRVLASDVRKPLHAEISVQEREIEVTGVRVRLGPAVEAALGVGGGVGDGAGGEVGGGFGTGVPDDPAGGFAGSAPGGASGGSAGAPSLAASASASAPAPNAPASLDLTEGSPNPLLTGIISPTALAVSNDRETFFVGDTAGCLHVLIVADGHIVYKRKIAGVHPLPVNAATYLPSESCVVTVGYEGTCRGVVGATGQPSFQHSDSRVCPLLSVAHLPRDGPLYRALLGSRPTSARPGENALLVQRGEGSRPGSGRPGSGASTGAGAASTAASGAWEDEEDPGSRPLSLREEQRELLLSRGSTRDGEAPAVDLDGALSDLSIEALAGPRSASGRSLAPSALHTPRSGGAGAALGSRASTTSSAASNVASNAASSAASAPGTAPSTAAGAADSALASSLASSLAPADPRRPGPVESHVVLIDASGYVTILDSVSGAVLFDEDSRTLVPPAGILAARAGALGALSTVAVPVQPQKSRNAQYYSVSKPTTTVGVEYAEIRRRYGLTLKEIKDNETKRRLTRLSRAGESVDPASLSGAPGAGRAAPAARSPAARSPARPGAAPASKPPPRPSARPSAQSTSSASASYASSVVERAIVARMPPDINPQNAFSLFLVSPACIHVFRPAYAEAARRQQPSGVLAVRSLSIILSAAVDDQDIDRGLRDAVEREAREEKYSVSRPPANAAEAASAARRLARQTGSRDSMTPQEVRDYVRELGRSGVTFGPRGGGPGPSAGGSSAGSAGSAVSAGAADAAGAGETGGAKDHSGAPKPADAPGEPPGDPSAEALGGEPGGPDEAPRGALAKAPGGSSAAQPALLLSLPPRAVSPSRKMLDSRLGEIDSIVRRGRATAVAVIPSSPARGSRGPGARTPLRVPRELSRPEALSFSAAGDAVLGGKAVSMSFAEYQQLRYISDVYRQRANTPTSQLRAVAPYMPVASAEIEALTPHIPDGPGAGPGGSTLGGSGLGGSGLAGSGLAGSGPQGASRPPTRPFIARPGTQGARAAAQRVASSFFLISTSQDNSVLGWDNRVLTKPYHRYKLDLDALRKAKVLDLRAFTGHAVNPRAAAIQSAALLEEGARRRRAEEDALYTRLYEGRDARGRARGQARGGAPAPGRAAGEGEEALDPDAAYLLVSGVQEPERDEDSLQARVARRLDSDAHGALRHVKKHSLRSLLGMSQSPGAGARGSRGASRGGTRGGTRGATRDDSRGGTRGGTRGRREWYELDLPGDDAAGGRPGPSPGGSEEESEEYSSSEGSGSERTPGFDTVKGGAGHLQAFIVRKESELPDGYCQAVDAERNVCIIGHEDGSLTCLSLLTGSIVRVLGGHGDAVIDIAYQSSPAVSHVFSCAADGSILALAIPGLGELRVQYVTSGDLGRILRQAEEGGGAAGAGATAAAGAGTRPAPAETTPTPTRLCACGDFLLIATTAGDIYAASLPLQQAIRPTKFFCLGEFLQLYLRAGGTLGPIPGFSPDPASGSAQDGAPDAPRARNPPGGADSLRAPSGHPLSLSALAGMGIRPRAASGGLTARRTTRVALDPTLLSIEDMQYLEGDLFVLTAQGLALLFEGVDALVRAWAAAAVGSGEPGEAQARAQKAPRPEPRDPRLADPVFAAFMPGLPFHFFPAALVNLYAEPTLPGPARGAGPGARDPSLECVLNPVSCFYVARPPVVLPDEGPGYDEDECRATLGEVLELGGPSVAASPGAVGPWEPAGGAGPVSEGAALVGPGAPPTATPGGDEGLPPPAPAASAPAPEPDAAPLELADLTDLAPGDLVRDLDGIATPRGPEPRQDGPAARPPGRQPARLRLQLQLQPPPRAFPAASPLAPPQVAPPGPPRAGPSPAPGPRSPPSPLRGLGFLDVESPVARLSDLGFSAPAPGPQGGRERDLDPLGPLSPLDPPSSGQERRSFAVVGYENALVRVYDFSGRKLAERTLRCPATAFRTLQRGPLAEQALARFAYGQRAALAETVWVGTAEGGVESFRCPELGA